LGAAKPAPGDLGPRGIGVHQLHARAGEPGQQGGHRAAHHAAADHGDTVADQGAASHSALTAVSTVPARTARPAGTPGGTGVTARAGTTYRLWCG
jgi:hypothetical protein